MSGNPSKGTYNSTYVQLTLSFDPRSRSGIGIQGMVATIVWLVGP